VINLAQLFVSGDVQRPHEILHVELISPSREFTLLFSKPDFLFRDIGKPDEW
jgi:hypothetical protein